ncbi:MAG: HAMP domain-containing sensor histidine kinase [Candidatus Saccharimonadales bacterium]
MNGDVSAKKYVSMGLSLYDLPSLVTAAHELKAPLALIRQLALELEAGELSRADQNRLFQQMTLTSERALRLTTDLTKAQRLQDSLFEVEPLNPQQLCEEVAHELAPLYEAMGRSIYVVPRVKPLLVVANRELLRRIMLNFGDNALHYAVSDVPTELRAVSYNMGQKVRIGVRDFGPALAQNTWNLVRDELGVAAKSIHARPASSGLGLYIAAQFAEAMHGSIGATRHRDGATFFVTIDASTQLSLL